MEQPREISSSLLAAGAETQNGTRPVIGAPVVSDIQAATVSADFEKPPCRSISDFAEPASCKSPEPLVSVHFKEAPLAPGLAAGTSAILPLRSERSNSCSQAESKYVTEAVLAASAAAAAATATTATSVSTIVGVSSASATSVSSENLLTSSLLRQQQLQHQQEELHSKQQQLPSIIQSSSVSNISIGSNINGSQNALNKAQQTQKNQQQPQQAQQSSSSSRFFSSKLNTGSLWSLLSNSSNTTESGNMTLNHDNQEDNHPSSSRAGDDDGSVGSSTPATAPPETSSHLNYDKLVRFNVKYVGSTILNKNFTMPMLEWIAKDLKRQSVRGAQTVNHRQFNIPARDIWLEINNHQLSGISCKDGHTIFIHPMLCISKYAQLQHDQTCFIYLIRDTKDSPHYCHLFQAKSALKVHDVFEAIRKEAASSKRAELNNQSSQELHKKLTPASHSTAVLQKSLSTDGTSKKIPGSINSVTITSLSNQQQQAAVASAAANQFEDSYQFEVMFVKKVKLQCRRVPNSFVDDALETLKSFEVLKGGNELSKANQIKLASGSKSSRIISASVDERQEYDQETTVQGGSNQPSINNSALGGSQQQNLGSVIPRRGSSASLNRESTENCIREEEVESKSCRQSPTKIASEGDGGIKSSNKTQIDTELQQTSKKHHQSMDSLKSIGDYVLVKSLKPDEGPNYSNDFSPYNTITSNDLNERIAAIPVVSGGSVSLDHETRQRLARKVRETIMATAANIKKDVYASGDKLDSSMSSKALDSLSCTMPQSVPMIDDNSIVVPVKLDVSTGAPGQVTTIDSSEAFSTDCQSGHRRMSAGMSISHPHYCHSSHQSGSNNFDLFRRASARQVVKNRTMLLLIGKDELCTISIDKHQMLFSKSFNSIALCLQGYNNKDHFGLICRDSGKINPQTESYAGFIFKCQSEKVAREIMGALKQVIYNSQHNHYHGLNSPYNPLNTSASKQFASRGFVSNSSSSQTVSQAKSPSSSLNSSAPQTITSQATGLAIKRGFLNSIDLDEAASQSLALDSSLSTTPPSAKSSYLQMNSPALMQPKSQPTKNLIKSMFCDNCPLYWYHRLCCDIESLPAEASKTIILRRIDSSLGEKEQDELYSKFSEFDISSIDEHNEIFMSLLRYLSEKKQLKHNQSSEHQNAMALIKQQQKQLQSVNNTPLVSNNIVDRTPSDPTNESANSKQTHSRSSSTSGSLSFVLGQSSSSNQSIAEAGSVAIDNLKKAKNSISVSIENMLKRRSSFNRDDGDDSTHDSKPQLDGNLPVRSGSFKITSRETRQADINKTLGREVSGSGAADSESNLLKRSQSTSDYSNSSNSTLNNWRDSLSKNIINRDDYSIVGGLFKRRGSREGHVDSESDSTGTTFQQNLRSSKECLLQLTGYKSSANSSPNKQPGSPNASISRNLSANSGSQKINNSSTSMLSGAFWKKSIFDKIKQPISSDLGQSQQEQNQAVSDFDSNGRKSNDDEGDEIKTRKRNSEELRCLWRKAILEQITLIKMDKQNQRLLLEKKNQSSIPTSTTSEPCCVKLNYKDIPYNREVIPAWENLLKQDPTRKVDFVEVAQLIRAGVPKQRRGEIWMFLMNQYQLRHGTSFRPADSEFLGDANQTYRSLLSQLSVQQHEIFVDIGRTFPTHPYYSQYLSIGQLSLFNLLKAYSLLDQDVGYCQGLSFVAGILLLHVDSEDEAFELMRHLLFNFGLRKQYLPSMNALHLQLYQLTRLFRDFEYDLFNHFDHYDIAPSLYAAPWFLTLFASQFPLGFVSRLLDLIFLIGIEAIFRVSLNLLTHFKTEILKCTSLEATMEFMRTKLIKINENQRELIKIFDKSISLDLRNKLIEYEIEYTFYCAEDRARSNNATTNSLSSANNPNGSEYNKLYTTYSSAQHQKKTVSSQSSKDSNSNSNDESDESKHSDDPAKQLDSSSVVADATATVIIQHLLANNHLKSLKSNYSY